MSLSKICLWSVVVLPLALTVVDPLFFQRLYWILRPDTLPDTNQVSSLEEGLFSNCSQLPIHPSRVVHKVHDLDTATTWARHYDAPVIFRQFASEPKKTWESIYSSYRDRMMTQPRVEMKTFGNPFMSGTRTHLFDIDHNVTFDDILRNKEGEDGAQEYFASFETFLSKEIVQELLGKIPPSFKRDTNFISNFKEDAILTSLHSAMAESYSLQLVGRKLWIWVAPKELEEVGVISTFNANFPHRGSERDLFSKTKRLHVSVVDEGDLLVFPPHWGHIVLTAKGPNVMFNLRLFNLFPVIFRYPLRMLEIVWAALLYGRQDYTSSGYNEFQMQLYKQVQDHHTSTKANETPWTPPVSGCKSVLLDMLHADHL